MTRMRLRHINKSNQSVLEALRSKPHVSRVGSCNGDRPSCQMCIDRATDCEYTVGAGLSQRQAMNQRLEAYKYVLDLLRQGSVTECRTLLLSLKSHGSVAEAVESINRVRWTR
ncbi:hypothetical protein D6C87_07258 [Aureobasidium pullulans]|uniref:Zn(2)-C6 fungal-type domain-containing protein n=1 Tax=Aureobasidium pullulans TaxID=5580 RepID=A0AB38LQI5_AURPU|nr:hypothetical protein D6C94_08031 [Aureobasidium pullulans]THZ39240.1 hypothetical protein D6C87_07258 [Aureobasidium pullulans]